MLCCNGVNLQRKIEYSQTAIATKILFAHSNHCCVTAIAIVISFTLCSYRHCINNKPLTVLCRNG
jgi:hypothetical protein